MSEPKLLLEVESISALSEWQRKSVPPEDTRLTRRVDDRVRLLVLVNGREHRPEWFRIVEVDRPRYVGVFEAAEDYVSPIPIGTWMEFTADNIVDY